MIESFEIGYNHVGLGDLAEGPLMMLFATAQAHCLMADTGLSVNEIRDIEGRPLYPAYYVTRLTVPPTCLLEQFRLWERVSVGVHVQSFGGMILDSLSIIGGSGQIPDDPIHWNHQAFPTMHAGSMFIVGNAQGEVQVSSPRRGATAELPKSDASPESLDRFRAARRLGDIPGVSPRPSKRPLTYRLLPGRDGAPGRNIMFAKFIEIMDCTERLYLKRRVTPRLPTSLLDHTFVLDRETFYLAPCKSDHELLVEVDSHIYSCATGLCGVNSGRVSVALLSSTIKVFSSDTNDFLAVSHSTKLVAIPSARPGLLRDMERVLANQLNETPAV